MQKIKVKFKILKHRIIALLARLHFFGNPSKHIKVVGVTGTNGKTTVATLLYRLANALGYKAGLISTVHIMAGIEELDIETRSGTTPGVFELNKIFRVMAAKGCEYVFMEVSSHAADQGRTSGIRFTGGIFTNLTQDHLNYHKTFEKYFEAKRKFFKSLPKDAFALSNNDDEKGESILFGTKASQHYYGLSTGSDFEGEIVKSGIEGVEFNLYSKPKSIYKNPRMSDARIKSKKMLGRFNVYNLLSVWGAAWLLGFDMEKVSRVFVNIRPPAGRFEIFSLENGTKVVLDYAHTPDALENILKAVSRVNEGGGKIISIFGAGGDRDKGKRPQMGKIGANLSDIAIFTSDNPRSENPEEIIKEMQTTLSKEENSKVEVVVNRIEAIKRAKELSKEGDIIICAGKGHEMYQEIKGKKLPLDERAEFEK